MSDGNVIAAFSEDDVKRLTGVSVSQLRYWDRTNFFKPSLAGRGDRPRGYERIYTFRDVVCLKIINTIRNESRVPLPRLREVKDKLAHLGDDLWAKTTLYILNRDVAFVYPGSDFAQNANDQLILQIPLRVASGEMEKAARAFRQRDAATVGKIARKRGVAGNLPVVSGTRIPIKSIKAFRDAGYSIPAIREQYPVLTVEDIRAALEYLDGSAGEDPVRADEWSPVSPKPDRTASLRFAKNSLVASPQARPQVRAPIMT